MNDLVGTLHAFGRLFDRLGIPYAIMGDWAVRVYALPRPTYDVDFTFILQRERLPELYAAAEEDGFTVPDHYRGAGSIRSPTCRSSSFGCTLRDMASTSISSLLNRTTRDN